MSIEQQIADARVAAGSNKLFAAKIASAYAATWRYRYVKAIAPELVESIEAASANSFTVTVSGLSFVAEATAPGNDFIVESTNFPLLPGNGVRVRVSVEFSPNPPTTGNLTIDLRRVSPSPAVVATADLNADGTADFSYISDEDAIFQIQILGGQNASSVADWTTGQVANVTISITPFPPGFGVTSFPLNPAIPFHRVVLAIPDDSFNCIVRATFENGGSIQGTPVEVAVGKVPNQSIFNPPTKNLQCRLITADDAGSSESMLLNNQTITDESGDVISSNVAVFEWTAVADKVNFEILNASINSGTVGVGIMQMPPS